MNTHADHIDELIAVYLAGEGSDEQHRALEEWVQVSESNRRYLEEMKLIFETSRAVGLSSQAFNTDAAWERVRVQLRKGRGRGAALRVDFKLYLRIAASVLVFLVVGYSAFRYFQLDHVQATELTSGQAIYADSLPEGTHVVLNRHTKLQYVFDERRNQLTADLQGEAYFEIRNSRDKTFIVRAEETYIRDIGTVFNVEAHPDSSSIKVAVEEGEVMFYTAENEGVRVSTGRMGIYDKQRRTFRVADPEPNVTAYSTRIFTFTNSSLETIVKTLNAVYTTRLAIDDNLRTCRLTVSFENESIEEIALVIAETLGLGVSKSDHLITLKGPGCAGADLQ